MDCQNAECSRTCLLSQSSFCLQRVWRCSLLCVCLCFLTLNGMEGRDKAVLLLLPHPLLMLLHLFRVWWSLCKAGKTSSLSCLWKCIPPNLIVNEQASGGWWAPAGSCRRASAFVLHESSWGSATFFWCQNTHCSFGWPLANVYGFMQNAGWANSTWYPL